MKSAQLIAKMRGVSLRYGNTIALDDIHLDIPAGKTVAFIGPDGVGKSSLLSLISGSREIQKGTIEVFEGDMANHHIREKVASRVAYMPQGLGKKLYGSLSVFDNVDFFGRLFGLSQNLREKRILTLLEATGLDRFRDRPASKLSGGMQQKLAICCALIHEPDLLILDEPTTGIDPLSRRIFWELIDSVREARPKMSVLVATAYMEEASRFEWLIALHQGKILFSGHVDEFLTKENSSTMEEAFIAMLPKENLSAYQPVVLLPFQRQNPPETFIEADLLTKKFGSFYAVNHVSFKIERGEIFGFLGPNGCGKTTTMKMLTGLLPPTDGEAKLFGHVLNPHDIDSRKRIGYMSQSFSLYSELTVKQNLLLHARLFDLPEEEIPQKVDEIVRRFGLEKDLDSLPSTISQGQRQRLSLATAMIPSPEILILDEPTSGVDPIARDAFWQMMMELSRKDKVTIFISTHYMNEAERCDRISLMDGGRVLVTAKPDELIKKCKVDNLDAAFIKYLEENDENVEKQAEKGIAAFAQTEIEEKNDDEDEEERKAFSFSRMISYVRREALEMLHDSSRLTFSIVGCIILLLAFGFGMSVDVENLAFAVLDRDQTNISQDYIYSISGSRYFIEKPPIKDYNDLNQRMRNGEITLAIEIPPGFARDIHQGKSPSVGTWIDGAMPRRAEIILSYVQGMNQDWMNKSAKQWLKKSLPPEPISIETRFMYNPDIKSQKAMVPAAFAIVLMMIPAMLTALSVVREKELGTIVNLYVSPTTRLEFLIGKQIPCIILGMISFLLMVVVSYFVFDVSPQNHFFTLFIGTLLFITTSSAIGLFVSTFTYSQTAAIFATGVLTLIPTISFSGILDPISSLEGVGKWIGHLFPTTFYLVIARGVFAKNLGFRELAAWFAPLIIAIPVLLGLSTLFLKKQER